MPISPMTLVIPVLIFLARSSLSGIFIGAVLAIASMHLYPDMMQYPYEWIGETLTKLGLIEE